MLRSAVSRVSRFAESPFMTLPETPKTLLPPLGLEPLLGPNSVPCSVPGSITMVAFGQRMTQMLTTSADRSTIVRFGISTTDYSEHREPNHEGGDHVKWRYNTRIKGLIGRCTFLLDTCSNQSRACPFRLNSLYVLEEHS